MDAAKDYLWNNPPACIAGFQACVVKSTGANTERQTTIFDLHCKCGSSKGSVVGYPLRSLGRDYSGPEVFVSPLAFACSSCRKVTEIIDTDVDGYHGALRKHLGESTSPVVIRGTGPRSTFECHKCKSSQMLVTVGFDYSGAEQDIESEEQTGCMEDFFVSFYVQGTCTDCGEKSQIARFVHL